MFRHLSLCRTLSPFSPFLSSPPRVGALFVRRCGLFSSVLLRVCERIFLLPLFVLPFISPSRVHLAFLSLSLSVLVLFALFTLFSLAPCARRFILPAGTYSARRAFIFQHSRPLFPRRSQHLSEFFRARVFSLLLSIAFSFFPLLVRFISPVLYIPPASYRTRQIIPDVFPRTFAVAHSFLLYRVRAYYPRFYNFLYS